MEKKTLATTLSHTMNQLFRFDVHRIIQNMFLYISLQMQNGNKNKI